MNDVIYEVTIGLYEDLTIIGTYPTRELALQALGEFALGTTQGGQPNRVEYPAINEVQTRLGTLKDELAREVEYRRVHGYENSPGVIDEIRAAIRHLSAH